MRVLQVNCVYGKGSTGKITRDIHKALIENRVESYVCYGRGSETDDRNVIRVSSDFMSKVRRVIASVNGMPYRFAPWTNRKLEKEIIRLKPDIVHLQCINGYFTDIYRLLHFLKNRNINTVLTLHAEFMHTGGCGYALDCDQWIEGCQRCGRLKSGLDVFGMDKVKKNYSLMLQAVADFPQLTVVGVSQWISQRAGNSRIMAGCNITTIHNGIETRTVFYPQESNVREKYGIPSDKKLVLSVVPSLTSDLKGGPLMLKLATDAPRDDCVFVVVGAREELEDKPDNLIVIPYTESQKELAELYSAADVFIMGSQMDNFPTVCLEAISCGTPVVGFDVGGVAETIYPNMGCVVPYGDISALKEKVVEWADKKRAISQETLTRARDKNSKERMTADYLALYAKLLNYHSNGE